VRSDEPAPQATPSPPARKSARLLFASVGLLVGFALLLHAGGLPLLPPKGALDNVDGIDIAGFSVLLVVQQVLRFGRCHFLIAPLARLPLRRLMTINAIALALITFLPLRIGEVSRPAMLREKGHLSAWAVTGTVGAERIIDGVLFSVMLLLGLALAHPHEPLPSHIGTLPVPASLIPRVARLACLGFAAAFALMAAFYWHRALMRRVTQRVVGLISEKLAHRLADVVESLSDGLRFLRDPRYSVPYVVVSIVAMLSHVWAMQLLARGVGIPELTFVQSSVVVGFLALGFGMPNAPGFFGTVQLALYGGLAVYIAPEKVVHAGAGYVFIFYAAYLALVVVLAAASAIVEYVSPSDSATSNVLPGHV
jgi:hypothetical protein